MNGRYGTVFSTFLEVELVSDRVNVNRKEEKVFSVRLSSMKAFRSGNLRYMSDRCVKRKHTAEKFEFQMIDC